MLTTTYFPSNFFLLLRAIFRNLSLSLDTSQIQRLKKVYLYVCIRIFILTPFHRHLTDSVFFLLICSKIYGVTEVNLILVTLYFMLSLVINGKWNNFQQRVPGRIRIQLRQHIYKSGHKSHPLNTERSS